VVGTWSAVTELSVVFADDLMHWPVHLLAGSGAVVNRLATAADLRTGSIACDAYSLSLRARHGTVKYW
jgi:hypothetical protein